MKNKKLKNLVNEVIKLLKKKYQEIYLKKNLILIN